jgi:hypothetical protein
MTENRRKKKRWAKGPPDPQRLIWHIEAAVQEADLYDAMAGFLLRVTIESLRKVAQQKENETTRDAA